MKHHVKVARDTLIALDFRLDHKDRELRSDRWRYWHPNEPDTFLSLNYRMSEPAARTVIQKARQIVGLSTSDGKPKAKARSNHRDKVERAGLAKRREAARYAAEAREREREVAQLAGQRRRQVGQLDRLMRGTPDRDEVSAEHLPAEAMFTLDQVAVETGMPDRAVRRAVEDGALEAYMTRGKVIKVKGADVREWLGAAS